MCLPRILLAVLALAVSIPAAAAGEPAWLLSIGGDVDEDGGYRADAGLMWAPSLVTSVVAQAAVADTSTDLEHFKADAATLGFDHFFGQVGLNLDVRWWDQQDLFSSTTLGASFYYKQRRLAHQSAGRGPQLRSRRIQFRYRRADSWRAGTDRRPGQMQPRQYRLWPCR